MSKKFNKDTADSIHRRAAEILEGLFDEYGIDDLDDKVFYEYVNYVHSRLKEDNEQAIAESIDWLDMSGKK